MRSPPGTITLHTRIKGRAWTFNEKGERVAKIFDTTPGRLFLGQLLPEHVKIPFDVVNKLMTKKEISNMIDIVYRNCGQKETVIFCDRIMALGFREAFKAGISFGKDDMVVPDTKQKLIAETSALAKEYEQQYNDGLITQGEKYNKVVDAWAKCSDKLAEEMMAGISAVRKDEHGRDRPINSIYMMSHSGARGSPTQMRQLAAMRGLMAKPSGEIIESPIISNFKEGLSVLEYFNSTHGARKGLADTALKTANSGYLTRRLVDVAQDSIITMPDCGSTRGISMRAIIDAGTVVASLASRILGRTSADALRDADGKVIVEAGRMIVEEDMPAITAAGIQEVKIRSVLTCEAKNGVCGACYGRDLARGTPVNMGEAVGVIAAQSIGEPGTQLTMRTFHIGGAAQLADQSFIEFELRRRGEDPQPQPRAQLERRSDGDGAQRRRRHHRSKRSRARGAPGAVWRPPQGRRGRQDQARAEDRRVGSVHPADPDRDRRRDRLRGPGRGRVDVGAGGRGDRHRQAHRHRLAFDAPHRRPQAGDGHQGQGRQDRQARRAAATRATLLSVESILSFEPGATVRAGDVIARISINSAKTRDITGGLPRVAELFEARRPKDHAIIAEISGTVRFGKDFKNKQRLTIEPSEEGAEPVEYLIPKSKHIHLQDGDVIEKGEYIVDGNPAPHDILAIKGVEELAAYLVNEIQEVYRLQGVSINDKHIEVIVRQMLQKVDITEAGDTDFLVGEQVDASDLEAANEAVTSEGKKPATGVPVLLGITKASLQTRSFISAASFQETTRVLTEAAVNGKVDTLEGLKENVIVGRLIPAGTGAAVAKLRSDRGDARHPDPGAEGRSGRGRARPCRSPLPRSSRRRLRAARPAPARAEGLRDRSSPTTSDNPLHHAWHGPPPRR